MDAHRYRESHPRLKGGGAEEPPGLVQHLSLFRFINRGKMPMVKY
jgi:hypothetical protein